MARILPFMSVHFQGLVFLKVSIGTTFEFENSFSENNNLNFAPIGKKTKSNYQIEVLYVIFENIIHISIHIFTTILVSLLSLKQISLTYADIDVYGKNYNQSNFGKDV